MPSAEQRVVILGTGGTIAGSAARAQDHTGYTAGALTAAAGTGGAARVGAARPAAAS